MTNVITGEITQDLQVEQILQAQDWEQLVSMGMEVRHQKDGLQWILGDLASQVEVVYGKKTIEAYAREIYVGKSTLLRYRDVARAYKPELRQAYPMLSWSHFRLVAALDDRLELLLLANDNTWTVEQLAMEVKARKPKNEPVDETDTESVKEELADVYIDVCGVCGKATLAGKREFICDNYHDCEDKNV